MIDIRVRSQSQGRTGRSKRGLFGAIKKLCMCRSTAVGSGGEKVGSHRRRDRRATLYPVKSAEIMAVAQQPFTGLIKKRKIL